MQPERARILIVDDEPAVRMTLELALADTPHHVESVETAEQALAALERGPFDLLLVDKNLPGINGVELIRRVRQKHEDVWAAMITGYPSADSAMELLHLGVRGYLEKPFEDVYEVVRRVDKLLEMKRSTRRLQSAVGRLREAAQRLPSARRLEILVVSASDEEREWLRQRTGTGLDHVATVASAEAALAQVGTRPPDLVVCDAVMRRPDLLGFVRSVRQSAPHAAFAVLCEAPSLRLLTELIDARIAAVVPRPLSEPSYRARVDLLLQRLRLGHAEPSEPARPRPTP